MYTDQVVILGCGYTGQRVARRLRACGAAVIATTRKPENLSELAEMGVRVFRVEVLEPETLEPLGKLVTAGARVVHSIPVVEGAEGWLDPTPRLLEALGGKPSRIIYLSTTGVYGGAPRVDETTPPAPESETGRLRLAAELAVAGGEWSSLVLRPGAIYGPGRGVHESIRRGRCRLVGDGGNFVSRIHVDDLAEMVLAGLDSGVTGFYPVADEEPCTSREMAAYCAGLLGVPLPPSVDAEGVHHTRRANRRVDGSAIRELLGVKLRFPSYRGGVRAALEAGT
jgi:nucleoside-diphosphate-sugar epimerase